MNRIYSYKSNFLFNMHSKFTLDVNEVIEAPLIFSFHKKNREIVALRLFAVHLL